MPHFESAARGAWQRAADLAGVTLIDPRDPPLEILSQIARCRVLLSEALHGIIVADAMRVPWVAIRPLARIHRPKWRDWAETVDVVPRFAKMPPSTLAEWFGRGPTFAMQRPASKPIDRTGRTGARGARRKRNRNCHRTPRWNAANRACWMPLCTCAVTRTHRRPG